MEQKQCIVISASVKSYPADCMWIAIQWACRETHEDGSCSASLTPSVLSQWAGGLSCLSDYPYCSLLQSMPDTLGLSQVLLIFIKSFIYFVIILYSAVRVLIITVVEEAVCGCLFVKREKQIQSVCCTWTCVKLLFYLRQCSCRLYWSISKWSDITSK